MKINVAKKSATVNLALTGLMAALVLVGTFLSIKIPVPIGKAQIGFGNVFCIFAGLLLGPVYGGAAAGVGSFIYDLISGWADSAPFTLVFKFLMAFVCGVIAWGGDRTAKRVGRLVVAAVSGSLSYSALYLLKSFVESLLLGNPMAVAVTTVGVKTGVTILNAIIADAIAIPLFLVLRRELEQSRLYFGALGNTAKKGGLSGPGVPAALLLAVQGLMCAATVAIVYGSLKEQANPLFLVAAAVGAAQLVGALVMFREKPWGKALAGICGLISLGFSASFLIAALGGYLTKYLAVGMVFTGMLTVGLVCLLISLRKKNAAASAA